MHQSFEYWQHLHQLQMRFYYSLTTIAFATLGLSIQFSLKYGHSFRGFLYLGWMCLLLSALAGGIKLYIEPNLHHSLSANDKMRADYEKAIKNNVEYPEHIRKKDEETLKANDANIKPYLWIAETTPHLQTGLFVIGLLFNIIFVVINIEQQMPIS